MAKYVVLCLGVLAAALSVEALTKDELATIEAGMLEHLQECNKDFGVSEEDIKAARENKNVDNINPCLIGCMFKRAGAINEKGLYDVDNVIEKSKKYLKDEDDLAKFAEIAKDCGKVNDEEVSDGEAGCERAKLTLACLAKHKGELLVTRR